MSEQDDNSFSKSMTIIVTKVAGLGLPALILATTAAAMGVDDSSSPSRPAAPQEEARPAGDHAK